MKTVIFAKDVILSKLVEMLKICPRCKYVSNLYQTITFTWLLRINTYLANICICPHFSRQRKCNANLELQIYHIFTPFANISKSVFSSSVACLKTLLKQQENNSADITLSLELAEKETNEDGNLTSITVQTFQGISNLTISADLYGLFAS